METNTDSHDGWRKCSSCKKPIAFGAKYYICSVSTCNGQRTGYVFCTVHCFERHLPAARHKDAGAVEKVAPKTGAALPPAQEGSARSPTRVFANTPGSNPAPPSGFAGPISREVLVIASRLKDFVHARSEFNTSGSVMDVLSDHLRVICDRAIDNARSDGRKTIMDRDFDFLKRL
jgi:hypothetical protein